MMTTASGLLHHSTAPWYFAIPAVALVGVRIWMWRRRGTSKGGGNQFGGRGGSKDPFDDQR